jgi:chemotaxis signal transduction protein
MTEQTSNEQLRELVAKAGVQTEVTNAAVATTPMIAFRVGPRWFAVAAVEVREVVTLEAITPVPGVAKQILGVALVRGRLVPILDLATLLDCPRTGEPAITRPRLIVLSRGDDEAALIADETVGVLELPPPVATAEADLVRGELRWRTHIVAVLDVESLVRTVTAAEPRQ